MTTANQQHQYPDAAHDCLPAAGGLFQSERFTNVYLPFR